jgi:hypothetical protein
MPHDGRIGVHFRERHAVRICPVTQDDPACPNHHTDVLIDAPEPRWCALVSGLHYCISA